MYDETDEELTQEILPVLEIDHQYVRLVEAWNQEIIAQIRPIMSRFSHARDMAALEACAKHWASLEQPQVKSALLGVARRLAAKRKAREQMDDAPPPSTPPTN